MLKSSQACFLLFICLIVCGANAIAMNKEASELALSESLATTPSSSSNQIGLLFAALPSNESWIKQEFGDDFYGFYTQKIRHKKRKSDALKMDFHLNSSPKLAIKSESKSNNSQNTYVEVNKSRIEILDVPDIEFSDSMYEWNSADITIVKLGRDYQQFINDEVIAGQHATKEIWDGEETTEFEDFIDEHFGFHDSALIRYLALLGGILFIIVGYISIPKLMEYIYPD